MQYKILFLILSVLISTLVVLGLLPFLEKRSPKMQNDFDFRIKAQQEIVRQMILADVRQYGLPIYQLYSDVIQGDSSTPDVDFGSQKALKKLQVTYPESNARKITEAWSVFGSVKNRDIIRITGYLNHIEHKDYDTLLPNGFFVVPQLQCALYQYYLHVGKISEAKAWLAKLENDFPNELLLGFPDKVISIPVYIQQQKQLLQILEVKSK